VAVGCCALLSLAAWTVPAASEEEHATHDEHAEAAGHHGSDEHHFKNGLSVFLGATDEPGHGTEFTIGGEYGRALSPNWTVGGLIDWAAGDQRNLVIAPAVWWKPFGKGLLLLAAPGIEWHDGRGGTVDHHLKAEEPEVDEDETFFVMRLGVGYSFHVGSRYGVIPQVNLDLVDGHEVWVYGVAFEVMF
jgi:hypothetical protein